MRTPLNSVIGFANVLRKNKAGNLREAELGYLDRVHANGTHLLGLINDILDLSKIEAGRMETTIVPVALDSVVLETLGQLKGSLEVMSFRLQPLLGMAVPITGRSDPGLRTTLRHGPSGTELRTAAPVDNQGDGSSFSPTDLLAAALGSCMVTTMAIVAEREGIPFSGAEFSLEKHMRSEPRRVGNVPCGSVCPGG